MNITFQSIKKKKMRHWRKIADHKYAEKGICMMQ